MKLNIFRNDGFDKQQLSFRKETYWSFPINGNGV
jgi:hypothetical protein